MAWPFHCSRMGDKDETICRRGNGGQKSDANQEDSHVVVRVRFRSIGSVTGFGSHVHGSC